MKALSNPYRKAAVVPGRDSGRCGSGYRSFGWQDHLHCFSSFRGIRAGQSGGSRSECPCSGPADQRAYEMN